MSKSKPSSKDVPNQEEEEDYEALQEEAQRKLDNFTFNAQDYDYKEGGVDVDDHSDFSDIDLDEELGELSGDVEEEFAALNKEICGDADFGQEENDDESFDGLLDDLHDSDANHNNKTKKNTVQPSKSSKPPVKQPPSAVETSQSPPTSKPVPSVPAKNTAKNTTKNVATSAKPSAKPTPTSPSPHQSSQQSSEQSSEQSSPSVSAAPGSSADFDKLIKLLKESIDDINSHIKVLLTEKPDKQTDKAKGAQPSSREAAAQYLQVRRQREADLATVELAKKQKKPLPEYSLVPASLKHEVRGDVWGSLPRPKAGKNASATSADIDLVRVVVDSVRGVKGKGLYLKFSLELGKQINGQTSQFKGGDGSIDLAYESQHTLSTRCRDNPSVVKSLRTAKARVELWSKGFLWDSKIGEGEARLRPLLTETECVCVVRLAGENKSDKSLGEVQLRVILARPFSGRHIVTAAKQIAILVTASKPAPSVQSVQTAVGSQSEMASKAVSKTTSDPHPSSPTNPDPSKPATDSITESNPLDTLDYKITAALLTQLGCPAEATEAELRVCCTPNAFVSPTAMTEEKNRALALAQKAAGDHKKALVERAQELNQMIETFTMLQSLGKLTFEQYLENVKDAIVRDKAVIKALLMVDRHLRSQGLSVAAAEQMRKAKEVMVRVKCMEGEVEAMEAMEDEDEDEEE